MTAILDYSALSAFSLNALRSRESSFSDTVSRISSGLRMTGAGDDPAAWMMGVRLDNRARGWTEASRNVQNGLSLLEVAEGGTQSISAALARIKELAIQSASGTYTNVDRGLIQDEVDALRQQIFDTIETTRFNGLQPLAGNASFTPPGFDFTALVPPGINASVTAATQTNVSPGYAVDITAAAQPAEVTSPQAAGQVPAGDPPTVLTITTEVGTVNVTLTDADDPFDPVNGWLPIINNSVAAIGATADYLVFGADSYLRFTTTGKGSTSSVSVLSNKVFDTSGFTTTAQQGQGVDMAGTINGGAFTAVGRTVTAGPASGAAEGLSFTFTADPAPGVTPSAGYIGVTVTPPTFSNFTHIVQMAPDHLDEHVVSIESLKAGALADTGANTLGTLDVSTQAGAQAAMDVVDAALVEVSQARASIGAHLVSLDGELQSAVDGATNLGSAQARISDADVAAESTALMQGQLAQQTGLSVLAALHAQSAASLEFMVNMLKASPLQSAA